MPDEFLTTAEISKILNVSANRVAYLCLHKKIIGAKKISHIWIAPRQSVEVYKKLHPHNNNNNKKNQG